MRIIEGILRFLGLCIKKHNEQIKNKELKDIRNNKTLTTIQNKVSGIDTTDFKKAQQQKDEGFLRGYFSTMNHLILYNYHPKAQEIMKLKNLHNQSIDTSPDLTKEIKLTLDSEKLIKPVDKELEEKFNEFQNLIECFEIRRFVFEAIDQYKGINRKDEWYKKMIAFCMNEKNFQGLPVDAFNNALQQFTERPVLLKEALDNSMISSEIISKLTSEHVEDSKNNPKILTSIKSATRNSKWRQKACKKDDNHPQMKP